MMMATPSLTVPRHHPKEDRHDGDDDDGGDTLLMNGNDLTTTPTVVNPSPSLPSTSSSTSPTTSTSSTTSTSTSSTSHRLRSSSHPSVSLGSSSSSPARTPPRSRHADGSSAFSSPTASFSSVATAAAAAGSTTSLSSPSSTAAGGRGRGLRTTPTMVREYRASYHFTYSPVRTTASSSVGDGGAAFGRGPAEDVPGGPCLRYGCGCKKYRPNPWRTTVCCNCQHSHDSHAAPLMAASQPITLPVGIGAAAAAAAATTTTTTTKTVATGVMAQDSSIPDEPRPTADRGGLRRDDSSLSAPALSVDSLASSTSGPCLSTASSSSSSSSSSSASTSSVSSSPTSDTPPSLPLSPTAGGLAVHGSARSGTVRALDRQLSSNFSSRVMQLSPEAQRLLLQQPDDLDVIHASDSSETEAEVDEPMDDSSFFSSSPQPKANPRFTPGELTPEFLRPFGGQALLKYAARASPDTEQKRKEKWEKEMRTSWELMIDTLVMPPNGQSLSRSPSASDDDPPIIMHKRLNRNQTPDQENNDNEKFPPEWRHQSKSTEKPEWLNGRTSSPPSRESIYQKPQQVKMKTGLSSSFEPDNLRKLVTLNNIGLSNSQNNVGAQVAPSSREKRANSSPPETNTNLVPPPPPPVIEVVVASPHLREQEIVWVLKDIESKKTHMSSDLRRSFAIEDLDSFPGRISGSRSGSLRIAIEDEDPEKKKKGHRRFHSLFESTGLVHKSTTPPTSPSGHKKKKDLEKESTKKDKSGDNQPVLDESQQRKRVSFKKSKSNEITKDTNGKSSSAELLALDEKEHSPSKGVTSRKENHDHDEDDLEEWERGNSRKPRKEKEKSGKMKGRDKKDKEKKKKKKAKKLSSTKEDSLVEDNQSPKSQDKTRQRRYGSIQIGPSGPSENTAEITKRVSLSTIVNPVVVTSYKIKQSTKESPFDSLQEDIVLQIFSWLDIKSLGMVAMVCWRLSFISSNDAMWKQKFINDFKISATRENHHWTKLFSQNLPRGKKGYQSVRGKRSMVTKKKKKKDKSKEKLDVGEDEYQTPKEKRKEKRKKDAHALINSDEENDDEDSDGYDDIFDADICIGRTSDFSEAYENVGSAKAKSPRKIQGQRSREKPRRHRSADSRESLSVEQSSNRPKRKSKERSESVLRYYQHHKLTKNNDSQWKNRYRELMTDILIHRVLLKHTNRVIWGKNSIRGRSASASNPPPVSKYRKSLHILTNLDQITAVFEPGKTAVESITLTTSSDSVSDVALSSPSTPSSPLTTSASVSLQAFPPAFSSPSFYCPYKFRVCSQRGKLLDAAQFGLVSRSAEEISVYVLLYASREDLPSPQIIPFLVTTTTEGVHKEPAYHSTISAYGGGPEPVKLSTRKFIYKKGELLTSFCVALKPGARYSLMTYEPSTKAARIHAILFLKPSMEADIYPLYPWQHSASIKGEWKGLTAGGCVNELTFKNNVFYRLKFPKPKAQMSICIMVQQKKQAIDLIPGQILPYPCHIGFYVYTKDMKRNIPLDMKWKNCYKVHAYLTVGEDQRGGNSNAASQGDSADQEELVIIPTTFKARQESKFTLVAFADVPLELCEYDGPKPLAHVLLSSSRG